MKRNLRKFIIKNYSGYYRFKIFNKYWFALKCTRIMFPYFVIMGIIFSIPPAYTFQWYEYIILGGFIIQLWITFSWFGIGYFQLFPTKWKEMDDFNKYLYVNHFPERITKEQKDYYVKYLSNKF